MVEVGTKLIFENEHVRVWEFTLKAGEVYFRKGGDTHAAKNVDDHRYHEVLVDLKRPGIAVMP